MNKRHLYSIVLVFILQIALSQNWDSIRNGLPSDIIERVFYDSVHNELIISSKFMNRIGSLPVRGVARWNGVKWDSLAGGVNTHDKNINPNNPGGTVMCGIPYNGKLLVGGCFSSIGGINSTCLGIWDGNKWDSLPKRAFKFNNSPPQVAGIYKKNNLVYIYGTFDTIAGQKATGLATWDGVNFNPIVLPVSSSFVGINGMIEFQGELYVSGSYFSVGSYTNKADVLKFNGTSWISATGNGLNSNFSGISSMTIYSNELYVAGHFLISGGDWGNNIMKYNGTQWQDVGFGAANGYVDKILTHNSKLWAFGCYNKTANMPCFAASVYDGLKWCALQDTVNNCIGSAAIYKDTIYVGGGFINAGGDSHIQYLAKLKNETLFKSCSNVGINEMYKARISIFPNPVSNKLNIFTEQNFEEETKIEITNSLGQVVINTNYKEEIDVSLLNSGAYIIKIITPNKQLFHSNFVKTE